MSGERVGMGPEKGLGWVREIGWDGSGERPGLGRVRTEYGWDRFGKGLGWVGHFHAKLNSLHSGGLASCHIQRATRIRGGA